MVKVSIEVDIYNMKDGKLVDFFFDGKLYKEVHTKKDIVEGFEQCKHHPKIPEEIIPLKPESCIKADPIVSEKDLVVPLVGKRYHNELDKWIEKNNIKRFKAEQFFNDPGNVKAFYHKKRFDLYVSKMIADKSLVQVGKDEFVVNNKQKG